MFGVALSHVPSCLAYIFFVACVTFEAVYSAVGVNVLLIVVVL